MRSFRAALLARRWPVLLALAIFIGGTNYCVAVAIAGPGARFACAMNAMAALPEGASADAAPPSCHGHAAKSDSDSAPPRGPMPCCITLAPSAAAPDAKPVVEVVVVLELNLELRVEPPAPSFRMPLLWDTGPPRTPDLSAPSSRAPPLA